MDNLLDEALDSEAETDLYAQEEHDICILNNYLFIIYRIPPGILKGTAETNDMIYLIEHDNEYDEDSSESPERAARVLKVVEEYDRYVFVVGFCDRGDMLADPEITDNLSYIIGTDVYLDNTFKKHDNKLHLSREDHID